MACNEGPAADRQKTDGSLKGERQKTDDELAKTRQCTEGIADAVVQQTRGLADEILRDARLDADAKLESAGASSAARDITEAERATEEVTLEAERKAADLQLANERAQRQHAIANLLRRERGLTDQHLSQERARSDAVLTQILSELAEAVRIRDEFLVLVSHELKTPLTPVLLRLQSLAREAAKHPDLPFAHRVNSYVRTATERVKKLSALIADILDVAQMVSGHVVLQVEPVDLGCVVANVTHQLLAQADRAGCVLDVDAPSIVAPWDELRRERLVTHLVENAIKFGRGKPIRVRLQSGSESAQLTVQDAGIGITPEDRSRIFGRFERAVSRDYGGLGLGLYACQQIVDALGGHIDVQSKPGQGTTFTVDLPLSGPPDGP